jgi:hypothetical protein
MYGNYREISDLTTFLNMTPKSSLTHSKEERKRKREDVNNGGPKLTKMQLVMTYISLHVFLLKQLYEFSVLYNGVSKRFRTQSITK